MSVCHSIFSNSTEQNKLKLGTYIELGYQTMEIWYKYMN